MNVNSFLSELETKERFTVSLPVGYVTSEALHEVRDFIYHETNTYLDISDIGEEWTLTGKGNKYQGTLPKRVTNMLFKEYGVRLTNPQVSKIGNIARAGVVNLDKFEVDFTSDLNSWDAGDYGDCGSCYWGDRSYARTMLADHDSYAIRFYGKRYEHDITTRGIGRAWIIPYGEMMIVYNAYGPYNLTIISRIIAQLAGASYKKIEFTNNGTACETLWINGETAFLIGSPEQMTNIDGIDLDWDAEDPEAQPEAWCNDCEEPIYDADNAYCVAGGNTVCESCIQNYSYCDHCDEYYYSENGDNCHEVHRSSRTETWCDDCVENDATLCDDCDEYFHSDYVEYNENLDKTLCEDCMGAYTECDQCERPFDDSELTTVDCKEHGEEHWCNDCMKEYIKVGKMGDCEFEYTALMTVDPALQLQFALSQ